MSATDSTPPRDPTANAVGSDDLVVPSAGSMLSAYRAFIDRFPWRLSEFPTYTAWICSDDNDARIFRQGWADRCGEATAETLASALWDCSTLRHGMFTPPEFRRICERVLREALSRHNDKS